MSYGKNDGGAAYPSAFPELRDRHNNVIEEASNDFGMSLRDHFAGLAMQGILASIGFDEKKDIVKNPGFNTSEGIAIAAYGQADAMIKAREQ